MQQQQQPAGASAGKPRVFKTKRLPHPTAAGNRSDRLCLYARAALLINWAGRADHVLIVL